MLPGVAEDCAIEVRMGRLSGIVTVMVLAAEGVEEELVVPEAVATLTTTVYVSPSVRVGTTAFMEVEDQEGQVEVEVLCPDESRNDMVLFWVSRLSPKPVPVMVRRVPPVTCVGLTAVICGAEEAGAAGAVSFPQYQLGELESPPPQPAVIERTMSRAQMQADREIRVMAFAP